MTKGAALQSFFEGFGLPAYTTSNVPEDVIFPYLTYEFITGAFDNGENGLTVNLWYYTESEAVPNAKAQELAEYIGYGGKLVPCDGGYIWIKRGTPWCTSLRDDTDDSVKRRYINVTVEYLTEN